MIESLRITVEYILASMLWVANTIIKLHALCRYFTCFKKSIQHSPFRFVLYWFIFTREIFFYTSEGHFIFIIQLYIKSTWKYNEFAQISHQYKIYLTIIICGSGVLHQSVVVWVNWCFHWLWIHQEFRFTTCTGLGSLQRNLL